MGRQKVAERVCRFPLLGEPRKGEVEWILDPPYAWRNPNQLVWPGPIPKVLTAAACRQWIEYWDFYLKEVCPPDWLATTERKVLPVAFLQWLVNNMAVVHRVAKGRVPPVLPEETREQAWRRLLGWFARWLDDLEAGRLDSIADVPHESGYDLETIWYLGKQSYMVGGRTFSVTGWEHAVLQAFLQDGTGAMTLKDLAEHSKIDDKEVRKILKGLREKKKYGGAFAAAISLPGGKGRGGYRARVLPIS